MRQVTQTEQGLTETAARWIARVGAPDCPQFVHEEFDRWRREDPRHAQAVEQVNATMAAIDRLAAMDPRLQALAAEALGDSSTRSKSRRSARFWRAPAAALAAAASLAVLVFGIGFDPRSVAPAPSHTESYANNTNQESRFTLGDGSVVHLDANTRIDVHLTRDARRIELQGAGRALFEVAHDASRPFTVTAGTTHTTALGTRFQVERDGERIRVTLAQGSVAIAGGQSSSTWEQRLAPGQQLEVESAPAAPRLRQVDPLTATSWTRGRLMFRATPLADALAEVNRYGTKKLYLGDPSLADMPVSGNFIAGDSEMIASAFAAVLPLRLINEGGSEILLFRRYAEDR